MSTLNTTTQKFKTYSEYAKNWLFINQIKLKTVYVENGNYNPHFVYINRIANGNKPKFRILKRNEDKVKNCIMITFNIEVVDKEYICYLIESQLKIIAHWSHGSCHRFVTKNDIAQILSGAIGKNGLNIKDVLF